MTEQIIMQPLSKISNPLAMKNSALILLLYIFFPVHGIGQVMPQGFLVNPNNETVTIGTQVWMKYNLDTDVYQDGTPIERANLAFTRSVVLPSWCYYNYDVTYNPTYGKLYNGYAVNDSRGICPIGFRVPTRADFTTLNTFLGATTAGGKLKEAGTVHWITPNTGATNSSGFTGLPGGYMGDAGSSSYIENWGYFWSSTSNGTTNYVRYLKYNDDNFTETTEFGLKGGASVRCIKQ
jgi:uncharacterized protein (TIGR02145 family)